MTDSTKPSSDQGGKVSTRNSAPRIALIGDRYNHNETAHPIEEVLHAVGVGIRWVSTQIVDGPEVLDSFHGVWVVPGEPYNNQAGVHIAVNHARTAGVPFLGTCGGFFSALLEHAENELRLPEVIGVAEDESKVGPLLAPLVCSIGDRRTPLKLRPDSLLAEVYGRTVGIREVLQCDYGLNPEFMDAAQQGQLRYSAWDPDGAPRALELTGHPFFMGALFRPELPSTGNSVHPIIERFLDSACAFAGRPSRPGRAAEVVDGEMRPSRIGITRKMDNANIRAMPVGDHTSSRAWSGALSGRGDSGRTRQ